MSQYDVIVIGAGPGGYVSALKASRMGAKVCVVEKDDVGGTCLNRGCIPTKALLNSVGLLAKIRQAENYGIKVSEYKADYSAIAGKKDEVVRKLRSGIESLFKARKIDLKKGTGRLVAPDTVSVGEEKISAKAVIIATGSRSLEIPAFKFDGTQVISSDDALKLTEVPKKLLIIGGGVIGCEFACIFQTLGAEVVIVEMMEQIIPTEDKEIARRLEGVFKKKGIKILTKTKVEKVEKESGQVKVSFSTGSPPSQQTLTVDKVLVSIGRALNSSGLGLEELGVKTERGKVIVDGNLRTGIKGVYAVGDVIGGYLLAHVASYEGIIAAENAMGGNKSVDYRVVPNGIYTEPEISSVGLTEDKAKAAGREVKIGKFPFMALGKAQVLGETEGFVKLVGDAKTDEILGAQIMGPHATDLIAEVALAMQSEATMHELAETIHSHPTLPEAVMEAAHAFFGQAIHIP